MTMTFLADASHSASVWTPLLVALIGGGLGLLVVEHQIVKYGGFRLRHLRLPAAAIIAISVVSLLLPSTTFAQAPAPPSGLPDLISDPPFIWFNKTVETPAGDTIRILAFDGYLHNVGSGRLEVSGNPQIDGGMKQLVFDGEQWNEVGSPRVKFETDDGHNHFHLMEAVDYRMWDEGRTSVIGDASKVGFCLIDTEQIEELHEAFYTIEDSNYCGIDSPDATELTMGISPGWRDTYDANVTFQWVDTSSVQPGRYWVSALTDPNDEIVESNEDNNDMVFSQNKYAVDGYVARSLPVQRANEPIMLKANRYGIVGDLAFVISDGPDNGSLDIPVGVNLSAHEVVYRPAPGFTGTDSFRYYARDTASGFPLSPVEVTVEVTVTADDTTALPDTTAVGTISLASDQELSTASKVTIDLVADGFDPAAAEWFAGDLPPGLTIDGSTGQISGVPTLRGDYESAIAARINGEIMRSVISLSVADAGTLALQPSNDFATTEDHQLVMYFGRGTNGASYEGTGMPQGVTVTENLPLLGGVSEELGEFDIEIREIVDGQVVDRINFTWTVSPSTRPAFAL